MNMTTYDNSTDSLFSLNSSINISSIKVDSSALNNEYTLILKQTHDYLIVFLLICVMFAMGCSVTIEQVLNHLKRPLGIIVGLIAQFLLLPFFSYLLIHSINLDPLHAAGLLILACCPGGVTSNIFTYLCDGDLSLSITMTTLATIVALLAMPLNIWFYGRSLETDLVVIPYFQMSITLILITIPVIAGMYLNWKLPKFTPYITKAGVISGLAIVLLCQTLEIFIFPDIFNDVPMRLYVADFILPVIGLTLGYIIARIFCLKQYICRTIAIEIGIKNVGTALTIVSLSFPFEHLRKAWLFPFLYAFSSLGILIIATALHRFIQVFFPNSTQLSNEKDPAFAEKLLEKENESPIVIIRSKDSEYKQIPKNGMNSML